jgi:hypothetical protein
MYNNKATRLIWYRTCNEESSLEPKLCLTEKKQDLLDKEIFTCMLGVVADPVALAKYRLWSIDRNDKSRC